MDNLSVILDAFPELSELEQKQFEQLGSLFRIWNERINLISRKDIHNLYTHHILYSLSITKLIQWKPETKIIDVGTGGGFPGIPLAVLFPEVKFTLVDSIKKKIGVVNEIARELQLTNVEAIQTRAEDLKGQFDFVVARAVANTNTLINWTSKLIANEDKNVLPNGWILLKGGDIEKETDLLKRYYEITPVSQFYNQDFFREKFIIYIQK